MKKMKIWSIWILAAMIMSLVASCGDDGDDNNKKPEQSDDTEVILTSANWTEDGYFDGMLYYKITSKSPREVTLCKADNNAVNVVVPSNVSIDGNSYKCTSIYQKAFYGHPNMKSITIPNSINYMGKDAFSGCLGILTSVHIRDLAAWCKITFENPYGNPVSYSYHLFMNDTEIKDLIIPDGTTSIGNYAFRNCQLTSVTLPKSITNIGKEVFVNTGLNQIVSLIENPFEIYGSSSSYGTFGYGSFKNAILYVPKGTIEKYKATNGWKDFVNIVER